MKKFKNFIKPAVLGIFLIFSTFGVQKINTFDVKAEGTNINDYYKGITALKGNDLLGQLHDLICTTHTHYSSYDDCKNADIVYKTDKGTSEKYITEFYSQSDVDKAWGANRVGTWNREHVWCQSLSIDIDSGVQMWGTKGGGSDLHHVRPVEYTLNSARNNTPYGEFDGNREIYAKYKKDTNGKFDKLAGYLSVGDEIFEPIDSVKGDVARILFYDYTHYSDYKLIEGTTNGTIDKNILFGHLLISNIVTTKENSEESAWKLLLKWNKMDPVSQTEIDRNEAVYSIQGNRNPFIDNELYADAIWGDKLLPSNLIEDTIDSSKIDNKRSGYKLYENISGGNTARYAAYLEVKSKELCLTPGCAIMTTTSGGYARAIMVEPSQNNSQNVIVNVYGSNEPYLAIDYLNSEKYGTFAGEIDFSAFENSLEIKQNFKYILLKTTNSISLTSVKIYWGERMMSGFTEHSETKANLSFNYDFTESSVPKFVRVVSNLEDYSGKYLIVADYNDYCLNGSPPTGSIDSDFDGTQVEIINETINATKQVLEFAFEIQKTSNGSHYSIKSSKNGYYIGHKPGGYELDSSTSEIENDIVIDSEGYAIISGGGNRLAYNSASNRMRFRYYDNDNHSKIKLYRYESSNESAYVPKDVYLGFGVVFPFSDYENIVYFNNISGFGVLVAPQNSLKGKTISQIYSEAKNPKVSESGWLEHNSITRSLKEFPKFEALSMPRKTDETGINVIIESLFANWSFSFEVKEENYKTRYSAAAYVIIDDTYCFFDQRDVSVCSLASTYLSLDIITDSDELACLNYFSDLEIEE